MAMGYKLSIYLYLDIISFLMSLPYQQNLRKDVSTLVGDERKRFFWCLKMIGILPTPPAFKTWTYVTLTGKTQSPFCLHDVLIASHASTCEHSCFFFPSYHRNQMIIAELFLNYADQVLTKKIIPNELKAPAYEAAWNKVFTEYEQVKKTQNGKVCFHYWNPTNYQNPQSMVYPDELIAKSPEKYDSMDQLFLLVRKSLPWSIYPVERWYNNNPQDFSREHFVSQVGPTLIENNPTIQAYANSQEYNNLVVKGITNIRDTPEKAFTDHNTFRDNTRGLVKQRNYDQYVRQNQQAVKSLNVTGDEILSAYNAELKNMHYLNKEQRQRLISQKKLFPDQANQFNSKAPHYSLANGIYALEFQKFQNYSIAGITTPHNMMHNYSGPFLNNAIYSPTTLMFFLYHSWIDAAIQIRIRTDHWQSRMIQSQFMYAHANSAEKENSKSIQLYYLINQTNFLDKNQLQLSSLQSNPNLPQTSVGYYPVLAWTTHYKPQKQQLNSFQFIAHFSTYEYYITQTKELRKSYQMGDIYQNRFYNAIKDGFYEYTGLANYDYNYNYQFLSGLNRKTILTPNQSGINIPVYLQRIALNLNSERGSGIAVSPFAFQTQEGCEQKGYSEQKKAGQAKEEEPEQKGVYLNSNKKQLILKLTKQIGDQDQFYYYKLLNKSLVGLVKYSSAITSGQYQIRLNLKNAKDFRESICQSQLEYYDRVANNGVSVHTYSVFSKAKDAIHCIKCKQNKQEVIELGANLYSVFPQLWREVGKYILSNNRFVASTKDEIKKNCYTQTVYASIQQPLEIKLITGAQQVYFETLYKGNKKGTLRVQADSKSILKDQIVTTASHINYNLAKGFDFYKLWDSALSGDVVDSFVYKKIRIIANIGNTVKSLHFSIPSYHKLIRYVINIEDSQDGFEISVEDADFKFKYEFLDRYCPKGQ